MFRRPDPDRNRFVRGRVLSVLHLAAFAEASNPDDPTRIGRNVLTMTLEQAGELPPEEDLRSALRYLEAKGALKVEWLRDGTGGFAAVRLLAAGMDLVEGSTSDPGVRFNHRG